MKSDRFDDLLPLGAVVDVCGRRQSLDYIGLDGGRVLAQVRCDGMAGIGAEEDDPK